jgi:sodium/hydrogen exchanger 8
VLNHTALVSWVDVAVGQQLLVRMAPSPPRVPPPSPPNAGARLELDIVVATIGLALSLMLIQLFHWRPSPLMTHSGTSMIVGLLLNAVFWLATMSIGQTQIISIAVSTKVHDVVYFGFIPLIIFEAGLSMRKRGFFDTILPILMYAVVGTIIATLSAGMMFNSLAKAGISKSRNGQQAFIARHQPLEMCRLHVA